MFMDLRTVTPYRSGSTQSSLNVAVTPSPPPPPPRPSTKREVGVNEDVVRKARSDGCPTACKSNPSTQCGLKKQLSFSNCESHGVVAVGTPASVPRYRVGSSRFA